MFEDYADEFDLEEELHYGPIKCDYCYIEYEPEEISYCEDPNLEEVKDYVYVKLFNICDSCCHQRVEEEECDYNSCSVFQKNFVNSNNNSNSEEDKIISSIIEDLIQMDRDFSEKLKEILKNVRESEDSEYKLENYLSLLYNIPKGLRINWIRLGNHVVRNLHRLELHHQITLLDDVLTKIDIFSNKQLVIMLITLDTL